MNPPMMKWYSWDRIKLRTLQSSQIDTFIERTEDLLFRYLSSTTLMFIQRLALLTWIGEIKLATHLWEKEKERQSFYGFPKHFEEFLFRILIIENNNPGPVYHYPDFHNVKYLLYDEDDAFKLSTIPLFELLNMERPRFSSAENFITVDFDKRELERLAQMVPEEHHKILRLPFILLREVPFRNYVYKIAGTNLENKYFKKLLKISDTPGKNDNGMNENNGLNEISMLGRRRFKTIYKILPESSTIWINATYQRP